MLLLFIEFYGYLSLKIFLEKVRELIFYGIFNLKYFLSILRFNLVELFIVFYIIFKFFYF